VNLIRSEWIKLRTLRLNVVLIVVAFVFVFGILTLVGLFVPSSELEDGFGPRSGDIVTIVGVAGVLGGLLVSVVSVLSVTSEFGHGTIRPTLAATPNRVKVFGAKALLLAMIAGAVGLVTGLASYLVGFVLLSARGAEELELFDDDGTVAVLVGMPIFYVILAMFGYGLGLLIRSSPAAVAVTILWPIIIENVLQVALSIARIDDPIRFMPYLSSVALVVAEPEGYSNGRIGGGLYFGAVVIALVVVAIGINTKRDV